MEESSIEFPPVVKIETTKGFCPPATLHLLVVGGHCCITPFFTTPRDTMIPFKFTEPVLERPSWKKTPEEERPSNRMISLHRILHRAFEEADWEADSSRVLDREQKDFLFNQIYPGRQFSYRRDGWEFDFKPALNRYVVICNHGGPTIVYAPDKTSIRKSRSLSGITEIHEIPNKHAKKYRDYRKRKPNQVALQPE
jgi:hypothetical protein